MSEEYKKDDRGRSKAKRLTQTDPHTKVDSSTWTPPEPEDAGVKTGARPLVKRLYKKGGKVVGKHEGKDSVKHAGRMPRKSGGRTDKLTPDSLINRDVRTANEVREGVKHVGGFKKGGKVNKLSGGALRSYIDKADEDKKWREGMMGSMGDDLQGHMFNAKQKWKTQKRERGMDLAEEKLARKGEGLKKGGRAHKFGGGPIGQNPISSQNQAMAKAAGMMKKGGRTKKRAEGGDAIADMIRQDQIEQGMKGRGLPERVPMPPRRPADKPMTPRDVIPASTNFAAKKGGKIKHPDEKADRQLIKSMIKPTAFKAKGGKAMHHEDCTCKMCSGGRAMKYSGGGIFSGDSKTKVPGDVGGRQAHAKGGRTKDKTNINIIIGGGRGQQPPMGMMGGAPMPNAPVPQRLPPPPSPPGGMPPQGMPPMPPQGGMPPQGMPMPRKSGGRASYPIDSGAGGGEARLEKIKAYGLTPPKRK